jgi:RHH-type proline utilization regulon transcriptional repressor/proline dehydrogenase/delta 1-pyrroline-5-carboxylate dehydrogenase
MVRNRALAHALDLRARVRHANRRLKLSQALPGLAPSAKIVRHRPTEGAMSQPAAKSATADSLPSRDEIAELAYADEARVLGSLVNRAMLTAEERRKTEELAKRLVHAARAGRQKHGGIDAFLHEYGLSSEEGIVLMCLAEALLRIPDAETADSLIDDKIPMGDWARHLGNSDSLFVNASTWGLMLTGRVIGLKDARGQSAGSLVKRLVAKSGEPIIRQALRQAMRIMGDQFVLGRNMREALKRARAEEAKGYRYSYDMLGEAARTGEDAERYFKRYLAAVEAVGAAAGRAKVSGRNGLMERPGLSVKLSAIHPRFEAAKEARIMRELVPRLGELAAAARAADLTLTVDAEEADRLDLTLAVLAATLRDPALDGWHGLGLAVQAYGKRALPVLRWLRRVAADLGRRLPVRLVKGAYWDSEVKWAQERGLPDYPVFTRKVNTDVSYLASARFLLSEPDIFYPQFATHNAHTIAAIHTMAGTRAYEFQRLHGMGESLYAEVVGPEKLGRACRIYAPVGEHEDLLAYLVRRLLENGANTSFVNRLADDELPVAEIIRDPIEAAEAHAAKSHPAIPRPADLFGAARRNSMGLPLWESIIREPLVAEIREHLKSPVMAAPIVSGRVRGDGKPEPVLAPHDRRVSVGGVIEASDLDVDQAVGMAVDAQADWDKLGGETRAKILEKAADLYEENRARLMAVIVREGGKTLTNAMGDIREAADFLRYYAAEARRNFTEPQELDGPTGERNTIALNGRGVFACISPWNFPIAIFTGQIAGALAAGNAVVAKPAEQTPLTAFLASELLHQAGVPGDVYHLLPGPGGKVGARLVADKRIAGVAFTGSNETAARIQQGLTRRGSAIGQLIAETGGMNAMIVDSSALPEQVVRDAVASAFDSAGQRCSALRVLYLQDDVAAKMLAMLKGAMAELELGDPLEFATDIGPVIDEAAETQLNAHKARMRREAKELYDLPLPAACRQGTFVTPAVYEIDGIHRLEREVFGPILHVVRYSRDKLDRVVQAVNATGYGLTLGIHSRIESTVRRIVAEARVGNIYVNRNQIGAVVGVQPFGGEGLSGTGPKAGGPHYLPRFAVERVVTTDVTATGGNAALLAKAAEAGEA